MTMPLEYRRKRVLFQVLRLFKRLYKKLLDYRVVYYSFYLVVIRGTQKASNNVRRLHVEVNETAISNDPDRCRNGQSKPPDPASSTTSINSGYDGAPPSSAPSIKAEDSRSDQSD